jgi:hypothetical protein
MNKAFESFDDFSLFEKKGDLKKLVGKKEKEELTTNDAKKIGIKVANMEGLDKKKYVGIINFLGASCDIYNAMWSNYERTRDNKEKKESKKKKK